MSIAEVQKGGSTANVSSGSAGTVLPGNTTLGNYVLLAIIVKSGSSAGVTSVSSPIGTFTQINDFTHGGVLYDASLWICRNVTGAASSVTVVTGDGSNWIGQATEFSGVGSDNGASGTNGTGTSTAPGFSVASVPAGAVVYGVIETGNAFTSEPASPWVNYNTGAQWGATSGRDTGYQIAASAGTITATYASATSDAYGYVNVILYPVSPQSGFFAYFMT